MTNNNIDDLLSKLPFDKLAASLGEDPATVRDATEKILPSLLLGLGANAQDENGRDSLNNAVQQHDPNLVEGDVDVDAIDTEDGAKITHHIFGSNEDQVVSQLGGLSGGSGLVKKLLPLLAPLVMSWLASRLSAQQSSGQTSRQDAPAGGGLLEQILGQALGGSSGAAQSGGGLGGVFGDLLGGLLGGGRR